MDIAFFTGAQPTLAPDGPDLDVPSFLRRASAAPFAPGDAVRFRPEFLRPFSPSQPSTVYLFATATVSAIERRSVRGGWKVTLTWPTGHRDTANATDLRRVGTAQ